MENNRSFSFLKSFPEDFQVSFHLHRKGPPQFFFKCFFEEKSDPSGFMVSLKRGESQDNGFIPFPPKTENMP